MTTTLEEVRARHARRSSNRRDIKAWTGYAPTFDQTHADRAFLLDYIAQRELEHAEEMMKAISAFQRGIHPRSHDGSDQNRIAQSVSAICEGMMYLLKAHNALPLTTKDKADG